MSHAFILYSTPLTPKPRYIAAFILTHLVDSQCSKLDAIINLGNFSLDKIISQFIFHGTSQYGVLTLTDTNEVRSVLQKPAFENDVNTLSPSGYKWWHISLLSALLSILRFFLLGFMIKIVAKSCEGTREISQLRSFAIYRWCADLNWKRTDLG